MNTLEFSGFSPKNDILCFKTSNADDSHDSIRYQNEFQVTLMLEGNGSLLVLDKVIPFSDGDLFLFGGNLSNPFKSSQIDGGAKPSDNSRTVSLFFDQRQIRAALENLPEAYRINKIIECAEYGIMVSQTNREYLKQQIQKINLATGLNKFLLFLKFLDEVSNHENVTVLSAKAALKGVSDRNEPKLRSIYDFIKRNQEKTITLEQIADIAHMSPTGFCRFFKTMTQKTFSQYLIEIRIENACELLSNIEYTISDCCYSCGYNNISNFQRHFKKLTGMSPTEYRANIK